jgi:hypothetical protein
MESTFHHYLLFHLCLSLIFLACQTPSLMMMMRRRKRRSSRAMQLIGRRPLRSTGRDKDHDVPPASPPPPTDRVEPVSTLTTMTMVPGLLQKVAGLLEVTTSIGRTSKTKSECVDPSSFLRFLVLYAKGEKIRGVNNFLTPCACVCCRSVMSYPLRVVIVRWRV